MTSPVSTPEGTKQKFVPKRRAPYLLQNEVINQGLNKQLDSITQTYQELDDKGSNKKLEAEPIKRVPSKGPENKMVIKRPECSQNSIDVKLNYHEEVSKLCGIQKRIVHYFVGCCMVRREPVTGPITIETLSSVTNTTKKTLRKIIQRVIEKGLMKRTGGKTGKSGFSVFKFDKEFIDAFKLQLDLENSQNFKNTLSLVQHNEGLKTSVNESHALPKEWQDIDFSDVEAIGFGLPQIRQIYSKRANTPETIQTSIDHFSFAMQHKPETLNKYKNKLATFMSVLQKGGAWVEHDYMSPMEITLQKLVTQKKFRMEKLKKLEEEFFSNAFELWVSNLTEEEKNEIIPDNIKNAPFAKDIQKEIALKSYFKKHLWQNNMPDELKKIKEEMA
jgi:hypothetical protein